MNKNRLEAFCRHFIGAKPEIREKVGDHEIYIAEGWHSPLCPCRMCEREAKEYPFGHYRILWMVARNEDSFDYGPVMFFDAMHDKDNGWDEETKRKARMNKAISEARGFLKRRERVRAS